MVFELYTRIEFAGGKLARLQPATRFKMHVNSAI